MPKTTSLNVRLTKEQKEKILDRMRDENQTNLSQFTVDKLLYTPNPQKKALYEIHDMLSGMYSKMTGAYEKKRPKYSPSYN
jgi:hypothetical protein